MSSLRGDEHQDPVGCRDSHLEVIVECDDIGVTDGDSLQDSNLVTDLHKEPGVNIREQIQGFRAWQEKGAQGIGLIEA